MSGRPKGCCRDCYADYVAAGVDSLVSLARPVVPDSGTRCATHWRAERKRRKAANHERYVGKTYSLTPGQYAKLKEHQTGVCAICKRATGATRALSVDHDHGCCAGPVSCGRCVRGLLCRPCNDMLGHSRDSDFFFYRAASYLQNPPAREALRDE